MDRRIVSSGLLLIAVGAGAFVWKVWGLDLPLLPEEPSGLWQVELQVSARGREDAGSIRIALPLRLREQRVFGEWSSPGALEVTLQESEVARFASFRGRLGAVQEVSYFFRVQRTAPGSDLLVRRPGEAPGPVRDAYTGPEIQLPSTATEVRSFLDTLQLPPPSDWGGRIRAIFAAVRHGVEEAPDATSDALLALVQKEANQEGRARLLVTLFRAAGVPARVIAGLELRDGRAKRRYWTELWWAEGWVPASLALGQLGEVPLDWVTVRRDGGALIEATGADGVSLSTAAIRERLSPESLTAMMTPDDRVFAWLSFYRLSVSTQAALRVLMLLPVGALAISFFRTVVGVPSYGTFMPLLIALALRGTGLSLGLLLLAAVIAIGVMGRALVGQLKLLLVPRLSILLCVVILAVATLALLGRSFRNQDFYAGIVFPIVILTMLIERFSIVMAEEGLREALSRAGWSILLAIAVYPVFVSDTLEHLMFSFPELVLVVAGGLVFIGGYTGYRLSDWVRFRGLARRIAEDAT